MEFSIVRNKGTLYKDVKFTNSGLSFSLVSLYFAPDFLFSFHFIFLFSIFRTNRVRVGLQDVENEEGEFRTNDITQHRYYMLVSWTTCGCLG